MSKYLPLRLTNSLYIIAVGTEIKEEPEVGITQDFEVERISISNTSEILELVDWCDAQKGGALKKLTELCIQKLNDEK